MGRVISDDQHTPNHARAEQQTAGDGEHFPADAPERFVEIAEAMSEDLVARRRALVLPQQRHEFSEFGEGVLHLGVRVDGGVFLRLDVYEL